MTPHYTAHAIARMLEREISEEQVERIIEQGALSRGNEDGQIRYTQGGISVLFDPKKSLVVTVYRIPKIKKRLKERRQNRRKKY